MPPANHARPADASEGNRALRGHDRRAGRRVGGRRSAQGFAPVGAMLTGAIATATGTPVALALSALLVAVAGAAVYTGAPVVRRYSRAEEAALT